MFLIVVLYLVLMYGLYGFVKKIIYGLAEQKDAKQDAESSKIAGLISVALLLGLTLMIGLLLFDYYGHSSGKPKVPDNLAAEMSGYLGTFGDFFGGVVNPVLTFGTLIALAVTILMQRVQLRDARSESKQNWQHSQAQAFETTFFNLVNLHAENVKNLRFSPRIIFDHLGVPAWPDVAQTFEGRVIFAELLRNTETVATFSRSQLEIYRWLQTEHNDILGHYFRHLYQILNLVNAFKIEGDEEAQYKFRKRYTNIIRAQLSSHELAVLLLNCTAGTVDNGKFRNLLVWYKFLEHLPVSKRLDGKLAVPGIDVNLQSMFSQYMVEEPGGTTLPGAFGKNPVIAKHLHDLEKERVEASA